MTVFFHTDSRLNFPKLFQYDEVWITTPSDIRIAQWKNVDNANGLVHLSMTLADEPEHVSRKYKERTYIKHAHASRRRKEHEVDIFTQYKLLDKNIRKYISVYSLFQGTYRIFVRKQDCTDSTTFKVEDYVLPRFEVTLTPPKYILATDDTIKYTVCAK